MPAAKSPEFRRRALELVGSGEPVIQVARNLGISESCLRRWMAQDAVDTGAADGITSAEKRELVELRRKNRVLEIVNSAARCPYFRGAIWRGCVRRVWGCAGARGHRSGCIRSRVAR